MSPEVAGVDGIVVTTVVAVVAEIVVCVVVVTAEVVVAGTVVVAFAATVVVVTSVEIGVATVVMRVVAFVVGTAVIFEVFPASADTGTITTARAKRRIRCFQVIFMIRSPFWYRQICSCIPLPGSVSIQVPTPS
jgi:hypothetical protein